MVEEARHILTVSQLTQQVKSALESAFPRLWVQGEVSNFTAQSSGHLYFTLKDAASQLRCVMFRNAAQSLRLFPQDGMQVLAEGDITVFERAGQYQLNVSQLRPAGQGELALALERLKRKLAAAGLFAEERKRPIPRFPKAVGIVTSPSGAAIRDIVKVARRRWPGIELILNPVPVQGPEAAPAIARAIEEFNDYGSVDVLIVGRGGGSLEDLWAFNEEAVARAIFNSRIPVISAVGHEIDFTIADLVADLRAPTPSAAAEMAVPNRNEIKRNLNDLKQRMLSALRSLMEENRVRLGTLEKSYGLNRLPGMLDQQRQMLDGYAFRADAAAAVCLEKSALRLRKAASLLQALNPEAVLSRGYSICFQQSGQAVRRAGSLRKGERVRTIFWRGESFMKVEDIHG